MTTFGPPGACAIVSRDDGCGRLMFIVGDADRSARRQAAAMDPLAEVIVSRATFDAMHARPSGARRAVIFAWRSEHVVTTDHPTIVLGAEDAPRLAGLPADLREELEGVLARAPVAACLDGDVLAAFCYPGSRTETLWDVSIDTLEPHRRRGCAGAAFARMMELQAREGRRPVWGAEEDNVASMRLAAKLGFEPVDEVFLWQASAFLSEVE